ncbi:hypothetical protein Cni_G19406 [Canna indica]|uniref:C2 domain-containing protein n=1 Tax=Canna indica TaxID=4628 RepID=A0AAQ3KKK7_9LILI|nr:hypothetical protein Cni_G19406 [Canna indica]
MAPPLKPPPLRAVRGRGGGDDGYHATPPPSPFSSPHLEVALISAQDLYPAARSMHTYAVAYLSSDHRVRTRVDAAGHTDPAWNEKFVFRVDNHVLRSETAAITIDIYAARTGIFMGSDTHIGTARALISTLRPSSTLRYAALQVRRPTTLRPQGILNLSVALADPHPPHAEHRPISTPKVDPPKTKRRTADTNRETDKEKTEVERQLEKWRAEIPPASGEMVKEERVGGRTGRNRAPMVVPAVKEKAPVRWERRRSFGRTFACFGGEYEESSEYVPAARIVQERPARRGARDY